MDVNEQLLTAIMDRLTRIETLIDNRTNTTHNHYAELKADLGEIKTSIAKIEEHNKDLERRVINLEDNKKYTNRLVFSGLITAIFSLAVNIIVKFL